MRMIEFIILMIVGVFGLLPMIGSHLLGPFSGSGYKEDLKVGALLIGFILAFALAVCLVVASVNYFIYDGPAIMEIVNNIFDKQQG
jgi:hypothetical protein